jgi:hypothetical protein
MLWNLSVRTIAALRCLVVTSGCCSVLSLCHCLPVVSGLF